MALNAAALDTRIKATVASTMYDMTRVNANGYFDAEDSADARYEKEAGAERAEDHGLPQRASTRWPAAWSTRCRTNVAILRQGTTTTTTTRPRVGYHSRSLNSNGRMERDRLHVVPEPADSAVRQRDPQRGAGECTARRPTPATLAATPTPPMVKDNPYTDNKELLIIPDAVHTDLYDGGGKDAISPSTNWRRSSTNTCAEPAEGTQMPCCRTDATTRHPRHHFGWRVVARR